MLKGYVYAENREGQTKVGAGNALTIREDGSAEVVPIGTPDEWERWNLDRDKQFAVWGESSRYLPDELHEYSSDFDNNGRWIYDAGYGHVWSPVVTVVEWAPYRLGRWWVMGVYVWISYEPWGWAPPRNRDIYWGPGYVGWVRTREYVGWVPLAPGEAYYRDIYRNSLQPAVRRYRNVDALNGATIVRRETFGTADRTIVRPGENPFLQERHEFVPPYERPG